MVTGLAGSTGSAAQRLAELRQRGLPGPGAFEAAKAAVIRDAEGSS